MGNLITIYIKYEESMNCRIREHEKSSWKIDNLPWSVPHNVQQQQEYFRFQQKDHIQVCQVWLRLDVPSKEQFLHPWRLGQGTFSCLIHILQLDCDLSIQSRGQSRCAWLPVEVDHYLSLLHHSLWAKICAAGSSVSLVPASGINLWVLKMHINSLQKVLCAICMVPCDNPRIYWISKQMQLNLLFLLWGKCLTYKQVKNC